MRVLIFEPQFRGHNLAYVGRMIGGLSQLSAESVSQGKSPVEIVLATSRQGVEDSQYAMHLGPLADSFRPLPLDGFRTDETGSRIKTNGTAGVLQGYRALRQAIDAEQPDQVLIPYGNQLGRWGSLPLGLTSSLRKCNAEAEILLVSGRYLYEQPTFLRQWRQSWLLRSISRGPWASVFTLDQAAHQQLCQRGGRLAKIAKLMPDPSGTHQPIEQPAARSALGLAPHGRALAVTGLIELRKGLPVLLKAMQQLDQDQQLRPDDRLLLAGPFHAEVEPFLMEHHTNLMKAGRVRRLNRFLSEREMNQALSAADVVATIYPEHPYTSSVMIAAAAAERPVLGRQDGWIGRTIKQFDLGHTCDPHDVGDVAQGIVHALDASDNYQPSEASKRFKSFSSNENFTAAWTARLRERLGLPTSSAARSWEWATQQQPPIETQVAA